MQDSNQQPLVTHPLMDAPDGKSGGKHTKKAKATPQQSGGALDSLQSTAECIHAVKFTPASLDAHGTARFTPIRVTAGPAEAPCSFQVLDADTGVSGLLHVYLTCALTKTLQLGSALSAPSSTANSNGAQATAPSSGTTDAGAAPSQEWLFVTCTAIQPTDKPQHNAELPRPLDLAILPKQPVVLVMFRGHLRDASSLALSTPPHAHQASVADAQVRPIYLGQPPGSIEITGFYDLTLPAWHDIDARLRRCVSPAFNNTILRLSLDVCWQSLVSETLEDAGEDDFVAVDSISRVMDMDRVLASTLLVDAAPLQGPQSVHQAGAVSGSAAPLSHGGNGQRKSSAPLQAVQRQVGAHMHPHAEPFPRTKDRLAEGATGPGNSSSSGNSATADADATYATGTLPDAATSMSTSSGVIAGKRTSHGNGSVAFGVGVLDDDIEADDIDMRTGLLVGGHFDGGSDDERDVDRGAGESSEDDDAVEDDDAENSEGDEDGDEDGDGDMGNDLDMV